jgi:hypothetical protein
VYSLELPWLQRRVHHDYATVGPSLDRFRIVDDDEVLLDLVGQEPLVAEVALDHVLDTGQPSFTPGRR